MKNFHAVVVKDNPQFTAEELLVQAYTHAEHYRLRVILLGRNSFLSCDTEVHKVQAIVLVED